MRWLVHRSPSRSLFCLSIISVALLNACHRTQDAGSSAPEYSYGTVISFARGGNSEPYRTFGWSKTEEKFTWSEGRSAGIALTVPPSNDPISLRMKLGALTHEPDLPMQATEVSVNGEKIADWQVGTTSDFTAVIPAALTKKGGTLKINLSTPKATSPKALGMGEDPRILGVSCHELQLLKTA